MARAFWLGSGINEIMIEKRIYRTDGVSGYSVDYAVPKGMAADPTDQTLLCGPMNVPFPYLSFCCSRNNGGNPFRSQYLSSTAS